MLVENNNFIQVEGRLFKCYDNPILSYRKFLLLITQRQLRFVSCIHVILSENIIHYLNKNRKI